MLIVLCARAHALTIYAMKLPIMVMVIIDG